jgi:hypothetical protein
MAILTKGQFESIASAKAGTRGLKGQVNERRIFAKATSTTSIFLSHSHTDKDVIEQAKIFFENLGVSIYVDWADETMPESTNGVTAQKIKNQIISVNDKFILLATNNAVSSKWCNWELGHGDAEKYINHIAILPIKNTYSDYNGAEYLQIYPYIYESDSTPDAFFIKYPNGDLKNLPEWLKS